MKTDNLQSEIKKRLDLYGLNACVAWERSRFSRSLDGSTLTAELAVRDSAWLGALTEVVRERCKQLEQKFEPTSIQVFFRPVWGLERLRRVRDTANDSERGVPLQPAIRYLATLKSGSAQISAIVDIQRDNGEDPKDSMVRHCIEYRLAIDCDDVWSPDTEPLLLMGLDAVKHYAAMFEEHREREKASKRNAKRKRR